MEVFAVNYAESPYWKNQLFAAAGDVPFGAGEEYVPFAWLLYVVKTPERTILVDTGFHSREPLKRWKMERIGGQEFVLHDIPSLLKRLDITPADVTDVLLTHGDFDHAGGTDLFPNARVHVQKQEWELLTSNADYLADNPGVAAVLGEDRRAGLNVFMSDTTIADCLRVRVIGGHSPGSCVAELTDGDTTYKFLGDECYVLENAETGTPIGYRAGNPEANAAYVRELQEEIGQADRPGAQTGSMAKTGYDELTVFYLPCHEPRVLEQGVPVGPDRNVVRITTVL